ncbi:unnamed protein product [Spirodela intermedia]|uniref:Protein kinase domain-containing protein n=1 Tax=Spirodela intermedia TaxID=51605 RepID=A0A7I8IFY9_SPIIN|nr:unnamed protein product [Spirodela intermedia]CAA6655993.1 unnamed protein product [Spirodela intermedia]
MTAAEEGRTVLVGVQIDGNGREVLDWALSRVAQAGDSVIAVHVSRDSSAAAAVPLDGFLAEYENFSKLKQVVLVGKVAKGSSIRKTLVKEARLCSAGAVVVGVNKGTPFGGTVSVAKYCAKKLPPATSLVAIRNGKVIFERETSKPILTSLRSLLRPSAGADSKAAAVVPSGDGEAENPQQEQAAEDEAEPGSVTVLVRKLPERTPGWPLLRKASSVTNSRLRGEGDGRKMSVVQWVMQLPDRSGQPESPPVGIPSSPSSLAGLRGELEAILEKNSSGCRWFTDAELQSCTDHFSSENLIGKGGAGRVYKGCLPGGERVAVKISNSSAEATRDFVSEVDIVTSLRHHSVVSLVGIGVQDGALVSVYRHFSRGSLEENLHGKRCKPPLPWESRFNIALAIAGALHYLHSSSSRPVIHRDVKSSNILLSNDLQAQLSDFGLAMWAPTGSSYVSQGDVYFMYGKVSEKIDVYSFGVVLLELVTGRKPISDDHSKGQGSLVMWATMMMERGGEVLSLLDPDLEGNYDEDQARRVVFAASLCLRRSARLRPPMGEVLRLLRAEEGMEAWRAAAAVAEEGSEDQGDEEVYPPSSVASHLGLALLDVDDGASVSSADPSCYQVSLEEYLKGRWSRSSSFD